LSNAAQVKTSGETQRKLVEDEGKRVVKAFREGTIPITWTAKDCPAEPVKEGTPRRLGQHRRHHPIATKVDLEKGKRREKVKAKRKTRGRRMFHRSGRGP